MGLGRGAGRDRGWGYDAMTMAEQREADVEMNI